MDAAIDRRTLLTGLAVSSFAAMGPASALAAARRPFFERIGRPIGLQLYTLGDEPQKDMVGTLAKVAAIGYRDIELPQLYGHTPADIKTAASAAGVTLSSIHLAATPGGGSALMLTSPTQRIVDDLGTMGITQAVLPIMLFPANFRPNKGETFQSALARAIADAGEDLWKRTAALLNEKAAALSPHGISLGYHNHNVEFASIGKTRGWEVLTRETDPGFVSFEFDVGWLSAAGLDPAAFLNRYSGRVRQLHVKDLKSSTKVNHALSMDPTEVGAGRLDWARILPAAQKAGVRNFYVEQEAPFAVTRFEAIQRSYTYLATLSA